MDEVKLTLTLGRVSSAARAKREVRCGRANASPAFSLLCKAKVNPINIYLYQFKFNI